MTDRIGLPPGFAPNVQTTITNRGPQDQPQQQPMLGNFRGETVAVMESPLSMLQDAAEELTFGAHERMTQRELGERTVEETKPRTLEQVEKIQEYLENLPDFDRNEVEKMMKRLAEQGQHSQGALGEALRGFHEDITYQQGALELMDQMLEGSTDPGAVALKSAVQAQIAENNRTMAPEIQAGLNVNQTAMLSAGDAGEVQDLRNFYRESVLSHESLGKSWANICERYGDNDLGGHLSFLLKALGADLAARGPSIAMAELKAILDETHQLETLATVRERAAEVFKRLHKRFGKDKDGAAKDGAAGAGEQGRVQEQAGDGRR